MKKKYKTKKEIGYAVLCEMSGKSFWELDHYEYCFTWDKKHPEEKKQKSQRVFAIYPTKQQAIEDRVFRGNCKIKKIILN